MLSERATLEFPSKTGADLVVCLDDEPEVLAALRRELREQALELLTTCSPEQAFEWIEARDVGLVLSDMRMPTRTGTDFLAEVRRRSPLTRRALLTGYPWSALRDPDSIADIQALLTKPWGGGALRTTLRRLLRERVGGEGRPA